MVVPEQLLALLCVHVILPSKMNVCKTNSKGAPVLQVVRILPHKPVVAPGRDVTRSNLYLGASREVWLSQKRFLSAIRCRHCSTTVPTVGSLDALHGQSRS